MNGNRYCLATIGTEGVFSVSISKACNFAPASSPCQSVNGRRNRRFIAARALISSAFAAIFIVKNSGLNRSEQAFENCVAKTCAPPFRGNAGRAVSRERRTRRTNAENRLKIRAAAVASLPSCRKKKRFKASVNRRSDSTARRLLLTDSTAKTSSQKWRRADAVARPADFAARFSAPCNSPARNAPKPSLQNSKKPSAAGIADFSNPSIAPAARRASRRPSKFSKKRCAPDVSASRSRRSRRRARAVPVHRSRADFRSFRRPFPRRCNAPFSC